MKDLRSLLLLVAALPFATFARRDEWIEVACNEYYRPKNCNFNKTDYISVDYMDRCAPSLLPILSRNYFLGYSGRGITYLENKDAFDRIRVRPRMLKGMTTYSLKTTVLGMQVDFPIGLSPVAAHKLAYPEGELATVAGLQIFLICVKSISSLNATQGENRVPQSAPFLGRPTSGVKSFPGLESVLGVMGPLALAAMVSLPFVAPAAAALLPLASVFGRGRRRRDDSMRTLNLRTDALLRRIHAAAIRRNLNY